MRLKVFEAFLEHVEFECFNSIKVRLKGSSFTLSALSMKSFNSIKVRLKAGPVACAISRYSGFQFHKGAIKSCDALVILLDILTLFQFHKGAIKSNGLHLDNLVGQLFQFHKGAIKRVQRQG